ncbi:T9SS type A sorting domain-containing protein [Rhodocytophaga rosea]|uniref:T9SS type A sorting domain-containing protein n=1 Tax=Rhodocytophaga rosea TaxID=2704465 RepID=A0A6C0GIB1_9BACT|nr:T9SS type A sorting domain-containing protein [Rhodocytophaga rosea]QHT67564.1 T9SS type A sorting domain-containing protein [Rhodocytophaga rosea]
MKYQNLLKPLLSYGLALFLLMYGLSAYAQQPTVWKGLYHDNAMQKQAKPASKVSSDLLVLKKEYDSFTTTRGAAKTGPFKPSNKSAQIHQGYVTIHAAAEGNTQTLLAELQAAGMINGAAFGNLVSGKMPVGRLDKLSGLKSLRFARAAYSTANIGETTSQGDVAQRSDVARSKYNVSGKGVKIGIISDSYNSLSGAKEGVESGDLPGEGNPDGDTTEVEVLEDMPALTGTDEGRGMAEIIHDVAPGASLAFHTADGGQANYALGILALQEDSCDLIVDDIIYLDEPLFQDGIIAQAVDYVSSKGVGYFCSAGNYGRDSYEAEFAPSDSTYIYGQAHSFANGDQLQNITVPRFSTVRIVFQWSDPFYSVSGGDGAQSDLDIYLMDSLGLNVLAHSFESNEGNDPFEYIEFTNYGFQTTFNLLIEKYSGPAPAKIKYIVFGGAITEHQTNSPTIFGHHNAENAIAVGAAFWFFTPEYGYNPPIVEEYSSAGGVSTLFDTQGNPINQIRQKPAFTAPDGGNTTFFGQFISFIGDFDEYPNFFGTSASAPHATAVAALMMEASNYTLSKAQIVQTLQSTSLDMDDPLMPEFQEGYDYRTGSGFIQTDAAVAAVFKGQQVLSFTLVNADNGKDLLEIEEGTEINLALLPTTNLNIRANTNGKVGSVVFEFDGNLITENTPPYALGGDSHTVRPLKYKPLVPPLMPGDYTLSATPYSLARGEGKAGANLSIYFTVIEQISVVSFTLVNADNAQDIYEIEDGAEINLDELPTTNLNIRANTDNKRTGSVIFDFYRPDVMDVITATENRWPFALGGDFNNGGKKYRVLEPALSPGEYLLLATPYSGSGGTGSEGVGLLVEFEVTGSNYVVARKAIAKENGSDAGLQVFPNPVANKFTLKLNRTSEPVDVNLYNPKGQLVRSFRESGLPEKQVDMTDLPAGLYMLKVQGNGRSQTLKIVKQ